MRVRALHRLASRRGLLPILGVALLLGLAAPHAWAAYQYRSARTALIHYHPEEARRRLQTCLTIWPRFAPARLLASRASREAGDLEDADLQLRECQRIEEGSTEEIAFEWALLQASYGNVREVEPYLQKQADQQPERAHLVWEALAEGYLQSYRILDAMSCLEHWIARDPDNVRALELRGKAFVTGKGVKRGTDDFRRVLELDSSRDDARMRLTRALLDLGGYDEAIPHLERLAKARPEDPNIRVRLARCLNMLRRGDEARRALEGVLAEHPDHAMALRTLGQFSLTDGQPAEAERYLRRAAAGMPNDYQSHWLLYEAVRQQGKPEAVAQLKLAEQIRERGERMGELQSRHLAEQPLDPALHFEMATLHLRSGRTDLAVSWLQSALALDANFRPAHAALADHYERTGQKELAEQHRKLAAE